MEVLRTHHDPECPLHPGRTVPTIPTMSSNDLLVAVVMVVVPAVVMVVVFLPWTVTDIAVPPQRYENVSV